MTIKRVYMVYSTYKVTGVSYIEASTAAEAEKIGTDGYADGCAPLFEFSDAHHETRMVAKLMRGSKASRVDPAFGNRHPHEHELKLEFYG